jgi:hypothetical protein
MGIAVSKPPNPDASGLDVMRNLWTDAGLEDVQTREITVERTFADFDDYWAAILGGPSVRRHLAEMGADDVARLQARLRTLLPAEGTGRIICSARANAAKGRLPAA